MNEEFVSERQLAQLISPHLLETLDLREPCKVSWIPARELICPDRFDLFAKVPLARALMQGRQSRWATELYCKHLSAWTRGTFEEPDGSGKKGFDTYLQHFTDVVNELQAHGYDASRSLLPVSHDLTIFDGAHRTAAAIALDQRVPVVESDAKPRCYDYRFFRRCGVRDVYLDAMALEYCRMIPNSYIAYLFPAFSNREDDVRRLLEECGEIFYQREIQLTKFGMHAFIAQIYRGEHWLGSPSNGFAGATSHVNNRYVPGKALKCYFFQASSLENVVAMKGRVRELFEAGNYPIHINDEHEEAVRVAQQILNENGIHYLNNSSPYRFKRFSQMLSVFGDDLHNANVDVDDYMIDGSAVMAAYGLRNANDLDYLHRGEPIQFSHREIHSHNSELKHYDETLEDMLDDPRNHFYFNGIKYASLPQIKDMKMRRAEVKDARDLVLIGQLYHAPSRWNLFASEVKYHFRTIPHYIIRFRLKLFQLLPKRARPFFKRCYRALFASKRK